MAGLLDTIAEAYMRNVGNPARQLVGGGVRGLLGFDPPEYADSLGMEAYRNAAALGNAPGINAPVGAFKAAAKVVPEAAMFIGALAKTWDKASNAKAVQMEKAGKDAREIWRETGNLKGPDGKWRQEIDDSGALFNTSMPDGKRVENPIRVGRGDMDMGPTVGEYAMLYHPELQSAYGRDLTKRTLIGSKNTMLGDGPQGAFDPVTSTLTLYAPATAEAARSTTLHELQHAIQQREGFARGGSASEFASGPMFDVKARELAADLSRSLTGGVSAKPEEILASLKYGDPKELGSIAAKYGFGGLDEAVAFLKREDSKRTPFGQYQRLAGEAEARATQARMNMTPAERRATFPYDSYDVPVDQLIVRGLLAP